MIQLQDGRLVLPEVLDWTGDGLLLLLKPLLGSQPSLILQ